MMTVLPSALFSSWTEQFDRWIAAPGSVLMKAEVDVQFDFATEFKEKLHSHFGRFLQLEPERLVELTWFTGEGGTDGSETVVTANIIPMGDGSNAKRTHAGFWNEELRKRREQARPMVLAQLEKGIV
jgi:uncharacterized protein YndB with AHSA1/START domain